MGEEHTLRGVDGSKFRICYSTDSAGIQAIDIVIWLCKRFLDGKPLDYNSAKLMNYVFKNAYQSDFSFKSLEGKLEEYFSTKKLLTDDSLKTTKAFLNLEEEYRKKEMLKYGSERQ